jgi:hypothetical protein
MDRIENDVIKNSSIVSRVFVAARSFTEPKTHGSHNSSAVNCVLWRGNFLPITCVATKRGSHKDTYWWEGFMKYAFAIGSGAKIYTPRSIKIGSGIQKLIGEDA